jgi:hypothetical protein
VRHDVRARFKLVGAVRAHYYLTAYRKHPGAYPDSIGHELYRVQAYGRRVLSVFRRPGAPSGALGVPAAGARPWAGRE